MNEKIIKQVLAVLKYSYPNNFKDLTEEDRNFMIKLWLKDFRNDNPETFMNAIDRLRMKMSFCPSIHDIKKEIALITNPLLQMNAEEEWYKVLKAIRYYGNNQMREGMESLNTHTRDIVRMMGWERICMSDEDNNHWLEKEFKEKFESRQDNYENIFVLDEPKYTGSELKRLSQLPEEEREKELKKIGGKENEYIPNNNSNN